MKVFCLTSLLLVARLAVLAESRLPCGPREYCPLPADVGSPAVFKARVELEFRRAGGPRSDVLKSLLDEGKRKGIPMWGNYLLSACRERVIDCNGYVDEAARHAAAGEPGMEAWLGNQARQIRQEAVLQGMTPNSRRKFYEQAILRGTATVDAFTLYAAEAAQRATREGFREMTPMIRKEMSGWSAPQRNAVEPYLAVAEAFLREEPVDVLVQLVRVAAEAEIRDANLKAGDPSSADRVLLQTGVLALRELRRQASADARDYLVRVLELYEPGGRKAASPEASGRVSTSDAAAGRLGELGWEVAEVIGDLGDRSSERKALGGRTRWDQVNEAETQLMRAGKLRQSEMVSK